MEVKLPYNLLKTGLPSKTSSLHFFECMMLLQRELFSKLLYHITCSYTRTTKQTAVFHFYTEPNPPTNLSAEVQCKQGYEIQIDWQVNT